jgi:chromosome partitioning protein
MVIAVTNQKGGVGKTTTTLNLGVYLAQHKKKVLLIDLDPQSNLTSGLGLKHAEREEGKKTVYEVLLGQASITETFLATDIPELFLVPSDLSLAGVEIELVNQISRELKLKSAVAGVKDQYDFVLIDCPPSLGLLTINALAASDHIFIPVQCEYYALEGIGQLMETIKLIKVGINPELIVSGIILTMFDTRTRLSTSVVDEVKKYFPKETFDTIIPRNVKLSEAPSHGMSISTYDPNSSGAKAYNMLAQEVIQRYASK